MYLVKYSSSIFLYTILYTKKKKSSSLWVAISSAFMC